MDKAIPARRSRSSRRALSAPEQLVGVLTTTLNGRYVYRAIADAARRVRFVYRGTALILPAAGRGRAADVRRLDHPRHPSPPVERTERPLPGVLRSLPAPPAGQARELQVVLSGRWQTFRTTRTAADGSLGESATSFGARVARLRYRFRARLPAEAGYAFRLGAHRAIDSARARWPLSMNFALVTRSSRPNARCETRRAGMGYSLVDEGSRA